MVEVDELECNRCGASDWEYIVNDVRPSGTERRVYRCKNCDYEGRMFTDGHTGDVTLSGAFRHN